MINFSFFTFFFNSKYYFHLNSHSSSFPTVLAIIYYLYNFFFDYTFRILWHVFNVFLGGFWISKQNKIPVNYKMCQHRGGICQLRLGGRRLRWNVSCCENGNISLQLVQFFMGMLLGGKKQSMQFKTFRLFSKICFSENYGNLSRDFFLVQGYCLSN